MGASSSTLEDDKALQLCRDRKKFVRQALDGRCSLAAAHYSYIESLRNIGTALRKFAESQATAESSVYTSTTATTATHEPLVQNGRSHSHLPSSSSSLTQHVDASDTRSLTLPNSDRFQANYMRAGLSSSTTVEERLFPPVKTLRSTPSTPQNETPQSIDRPQTPQDEDFHLHPESPAWDYFGLLHPIDKQFSFQEVNGMNHGFDNADDIRRFREEEGIPELEEEKVSFIGHTESEESEDEFEEPSTDTLVQKYENRRVTDPDSSSMSSGVSSTKNISSENKVLDEANNNSLVTSKTDLAVTPSHEKEKPEEEPGSPNNVTPKDFLSSIKEIELLFVNASDSGKEVPRMLEANKLHFRPIFPGKEGGSVTSTFFKSCFSCGEDPTNAPEEPPPPTATKYLTWHRTESSRSSSSRNPLAPAQNDDVENMTSNIFESFCMNSGSHASTLDRLYAWERKLFDEVKDSTFIRREYDMKCRLLREQDSKGGNTDRVDKIRATVKDLYSRIRVAIQRIDSISKRIEELRDKELQPQLEELIEGLCRMWEKMLECHKLQFNIIRVAYNNGSTKIFVQSEPHRQATIHLESELKYFASSFTKWIVAQKAYVQSINGWLHKCVLLQQKTSKRKKRIPDTPLSNLGPPIYATCGDWVDKLESLPSKEVSDAAKTLAAVTAHFLPRQEKRRGMTLNRTLSSTWAATDHSEAASNTPREGAVEDWNLGYDRFQTSLTTFVSRLNSFASLSVNMYKEIEVSIEKAKVREANMKH